jgi:hypothetical protein
MLALPSGAHGSIWLNIGTIAVFIQQWAAHHLKLCMDMLLLISASQLLMFLFPMIWLLGWKNVN